MKKSLGYVLSTIALDEIGVSSIYRNKEVFYSEGEFGPEVTSTISQAKLFSSIEDIKKINFKNCLMSSGEIVRDSFSYNCFGKSKQNNSFVIKELFYQEIEDSPIIKENDITIKHQSEIDPEYQEFLRLKEKFSK